MRKLVTTTIFALCAALLAGAGCGSSSAGGAAGSGGSGTPGNGGSGGSANPIGGAGPGGGGPGGGGPAGAGPGGAGPGGVDSYEPDPVGATWSYATTDEGPDGGTVSSTKQVTVEAVQAVPGRPGITATRIHTLVPGEEDQLTWQGEDANAIVRYRDDIYVAGTGTTTLREYSIYALSKLRLDLAHLSTGQTYSEAYTESVFEVTSTGTTSSSTSKPFAWKVINGAESVTVPAGTFTAVHVQKANGNSGAIDKDYWFVKGVGKVKETVASTGRIEVLTAYHIP